MRSKRGAMPDTHEQHALLWIHSAREATDATAELLTEIAPHWEVVLTTSYQVDLNYNDPEYKKAEIAARAAWRRPSPEQLVRDLEEQAAWLAESLNAAEKAERDALPMPYDDHQAVHDAHHAACDANARVRRTQMQLTGEYLYLNYESGPDLLIRNQNQATLRAMLRTYWQPLACGQASGYAIAPAHRGLNAWLLQYHQEATPPSMPGQYLNDRNTSAAQGLDILCIDNMPDWDCPMGVLMLFASPALAQKHIERFQRDARVHWWPDLTTADARWREPDWPPDQRVQLCPFDLRTDKIWEGNEQTRLFSSLL